jgi:hypothetical protein
MTIPFSGDASCTVEQIMPASPVTAVSNAMIANVGAAARDSQSAAPRAATLSLGKLADPLPAGGIFCVWLEWGVIETSALAVFVVAPPPDARFVTPLGRAVEPLIHAPEAVQSARIGGIGVVDDAVL